MFYPLIRRAMFALPPELAHQVGLGALAGAFAWSAPRRVAAALAPSDPRLATRLCGIELPNPVGLAAGFDKAGTAVDALGALGFGFVEIGTVTAEAQPGNPRPRLFRLPADHALINRLGFNNPGAAEVAERFRRTTPNGVVGINLGKSKVVPLERAADDYLASFRVLAPFARYVTVNVSSPNTPGLRSLQDAAPLRRLLGVLRDEAASSTPAGGAPVPLLLKIAPDLGDRQIDEATEIAQEFADGVIATNTTTARVGLRTPPARLDAIGAGGLSGRPLHTRAVEVVGRVHKRSGGRLPVVGVGGIFDAETAWAHLRAGASAVQLYTGLVYGGPAVVGRINRGLSRLMDAHRFARIADVVGSAWR